MTLGRGEKYGSHCFKDDKLIEFTENLDKKDSVFTTLKNKRLVLGGDGITPDIITEIQKKLRLFHRRFN